MSSVDSEFLQRCCDPGQGFDVVIVVASSPRTAAFWTHRLAAVRELLLPESTDLVVTEEDWAGGAGNGLGTLHALEQAERILTQRGRSLWRSLSVGRSVGIWHTAGRGKRLYPLPIHHGGDKSATVVPGELTIGTDVVSMRLLEAVLRQTSAFAVGGRISVFWGDQLTLPTVPVRVPETPVALIGRLGGVPNADDWQRLELNNYGLLAVRPGGCAMQLEKLTWTDFDALRPELGPLQAAATSLGSFTMTARVGQTLMALYAPELAGRTAKVDTDPGWWMPLTLPKAVAVRLCGEDAVSRVQRAFGGPLELGVMDVGEMAPWWDFGTVANWHDSCRAVLGSPELRQLLRTPDPVDGSVYVASDVAKGAVNSIIVDSATRELDVRDAVVVDCDVDTLTGFGVAYGLSGGSHILTGKIHASDGRGGTVSAPIDADGKVLWDTVIGENKGAWSDYARRYSSK